MTQPTTGATTPGAPPPSPQAPVVPQHEAGDLRQALLTSLGLPRDATPDDVDVAHDRVAAYLAAAPAELSVWAHQQAAAADAAHAVLTGKAGDVLARRVAATSASRPGATAAAPARRTLPTPLLLLAGLALITGIVLGVYKFGPGAQTTATKPPVTMGDQGSGQDATPQGMPTQAKPTPADPAKIKALQDKVAKNPQDVSSMAQLGDLYFGADDFTNAALWRDKLVAQRPTDTDMLLAAGVAHLNAGDRAQAKAQWERAIALEPKKAEAYYDLGFLYLTQTPPDSARAKQMWDKVVELDGNGPLSQKVQNHMGALMTPAPGGASTPAPTTSK
ncbi:tetratricopeptide repeat protein [Arsenicicoccus dermatophilus]|uniref:tetratricopeptide repeat protein n=1 Tax=Arsenicicoccus dermatophilus TaxID=1076331 RepID=UPI001F4C579D|nr:hypothetical protein [Arsenicicoccus dermatophilus]MCH8614161.1 hypothetical protein [Arsenicicoccus dermatophilus]